MAKQVRLSTLITLIAILLVGGGVIYWLTQRQHQHSRMSDPHFGIADPDLLGDTVPMLVSQLAAMKAIGITSVRVDADWAMVQPAGPLTFSWTRLDHVVSTARAAGMSVDLIVDGCPRWAALANTSGDSSPQPASRLSTPAGQPTWPNVTHRKASTRSRSGTNRILRSSGSLSPIRLLTPQTWWPPIPRSRQLTLQHSSSLEGSRRQSRRTTISAPSTSSKRCTPTELRAASMPSVIIPTAFRSCRTPTNRGGLRWHGPVPLSEA